MDYMRMVKEAVEHENFLAKQEAARKAHELEMAMRKPLERFNEIKDDVALLIQVIREIEDVCKNKTKIPMATDGIYKRRIYGSANGEGGFFFGAMSKEFLKFGNTYYIGMMWYTAYRPYYCYYDGEFLHYRGKYGSESTPPPDIINRFCDEFTEYKELFDKWFEENFTV